MSDDIVIRAQGLGKQYTIGHQVQRERYTALRDVIARGTRGLIQSARDIARGRPIIAGDTLEEFWALKDIDFEIRRGDLIGIIGRNGAGKSTLLKILSRITDPSKGRVTIRGRVASLLEVGTGFHPELTGRENIFLNGAILGMSRVEIRRKFDEIVAFAEVEQFLDTPVKRYSSGMYVRLAFAVAAHLEPEILVVDEVLAVGDAAFQKKCLGKMQEVGKGGRTVLFVSHNMAAVENLCTTGVVLDHGSKVFQGDVHEAVKRYMNALVAHNHESLKERSDRGGRGRVRMTRLTAQDTSGQTDVPFPIGAELSFHVHYEAENEVASPRAIIGIYDDKGVGITRFDSDISGGIRGTLPQHGEIVCAARAMNLTPGRYFINVALFDNGEMEDHLVSAAFFDIRASDFFATGRMFNASDAGLAKVLIRHEWKVSR